MLQLYRPLCDSLIVFSIGSGLPRDITKSIGSLALLFYSHEMIEKADQSKRWILAGRDLILNPHYIGIPLYHLLTHFSPIEWYQAPHIPEDVYINNLFYGKSLPLINIVSTLSEGIEDEESLVKPLYSILFLQVILLLPVLFEFIYSLYLTIIQPIYLIVWLMKKIVKTWKSLTDKFW